MVDDKARRRGAIDGIATGDETVDNDATLPEAMDGRFPFDVGTTELAGDPSAMEPVEFVAESEVTDDFEATGSLYQVDVNQRYVCLVCGQFGHEITPACGHDSVHNFPVLTPERLRVGREKGCVLDGRYLIRERLSQSRQAIVVDAAQVHLGRNVVVKFVAPGHVPTGAAAQRLKREAAQTAGLRHDRIVQVFDFGVDHGQLPYLAMEKLDGLSLQDVLRRQSRLPEHQVIMLGVQVCDALSYIHAEGIIHRDMKPSNIWCLKSSKTEVDIKLLDFGLCKALSKENPSRAITGPGRIVGTPNYMAPEQCRGENLDERADIYSLGCVLWEALTGQRMVRGRTPLDSLMMHINEPASPPSKLGVSVSATLEQAIMKALNKAPSDRWASADDMKSALAACSYLSR